jgi:hypothetical protein
MNQALEDMLAAYEPKTPLDLLRTRFQKIDFQKAASEVRTFLQDPRDLDLWSKEFFLDVAKKIR